MKIVLIHAAYGQGPVPLAYYKSIHITLSRGAVSLYAFILCMIKAMCMIFIYPRILRRQTFI